MAEEGSERDMEEFLAGTGIFDRGDAEPRRAEEEAEEVVHDERPGQEPPPEEPPPPPPADAAEAEEGDEVETDPHIAWATKKYGTDPDRWAKAAFDQERFISALSQDKKLAEEAAAQAYAYAQSVEANAQTGPGGMPMTAQQEAWVEQSLSNPVGYAMQAAMSGDAQLYNAVIEKVAEMDPGMAANVGTQVQLTMHQERQRLEAEQAARSNGGPGQDFNADMGQSFQRLGINVNQYGQQMWERIDTLGEYHPYTLAILGGDAIQRDLALQAVYDLVRTGQTTTQRVADSEREQQIAREGELRRGAAAVVTGSPHVEPVKESPLMEGMMAEWKRRGQWPDEE